MFTTGNTDHLIRSKLWSSELKEVFEDEVFANKYVDWIGFPEGDTMLIPSIGQAEVLDYDEGQSVRYTRMDTGSFPFSITSYKSSATYITEKMKQDSFYADRLIASFVPKMNRALQKAMETEILAIGPNGQTAANFNSINGTPHRWVGSGSSSHIGIQDFINAKYTLTKALVPMTNLVAIVDPSVEADLNAITNIVNVSNNPRWEGIIRDGMTTGMKFVNNIYGFDVYISNNLKQGMTETINAKAVTADGVANLFFSAAPDALPFIGAIRQPPKVDSDFNKDEQRDEYVTTTRYGMKLYRPENMAVCITAQGSASF